MAPSHTSQRPRRLANQQHPARHTTYTHHARQAHNTEAKLPPLTQQGQRKYSIDECALHAPRQSRKASREDMIAGFSELLRHAPAPMRNAILALIPAAYAILRRGFRADAHAAPIHSWRELLAVLSDVAAMRHDAAPLLRVTNDLINIADEMATPKDALRQSADILHRFFHADLFVCRLRDEQGDWHVTVADRHDGGAVPIFTPILEEGLAGHPVMQAINHGIRHVVSNDLRAMERGGESVDCMAYKAGCRSRLAFVLRERRDKPPFGLAILYSEADHAFDGYDPHFLAKCARIVTLTTSRRIAVARDTLAKAAGGVAHHGNNALALLRNHAELCAEILDNIHGDWEEAIDDVKILSKNLPESGPMRDTLTSLRGHLELFDTTMLTEHIDGVLSSARRIQRIIAALEDSAEQPRLMHYTLGRHVLDLGDTTTE
ncbi:MAG: hypothetical protein R3Y11_08680 [Pseudomonadota bacterium]